MTEPDQKRSYPYLATSAWADLRKKLRGSIPRKIDKDYLHTVLGVSDKAAANLLPQLKTLGLVDDEGAPTALVHDLRDDHKYAEACQAIIARVYPPALTDAVQNPTDDFEAAVRWFMRQGAGEGTAKIQARFYAMLASGEIPESSDKTKKPSKPTPPKEPAPATGKAQTKVSPAAERKPAGTEIGKPAGGSNQALPTVHVDLQIHISPDSPPDQIDAIFASMSKHLYGR